MSLRERLTESARTLAGLAFIAACTSAAHSARQHWDVVAAALLAPFYLVWMALSAITLPIAVLILAAVVYMRVGRNSKPEGK